MCMVVEGLVFANFLCSPFFLLINSASFNVGHNKKEFLKNSPPFKNLLGGKWLIVDCSYGSVYNLSIVALVGFGVWS